MSTPVRPYRADDREPVVELSVRAWEPVFASVGRVLEGSGVFEQLHPDWRAGQRAAVRAALDDEAVPVWVAELNGRVAGFVAARADPDASLGEIHMIAVEPADQAAGVGSLLTQHALTWMREQGLATAMVETGGDDGHAPARRTYERAGFSPLPVVRYFRLL